MLELSLHLLDVMRNAVEADASRVEVRIEEERAADWLRIEVRDDGRGMTLEEAGRAVDPFFTSRATRHVGLGLPLLAQAARQCEGELDIESAPGDGTRVVASFRHSHWDRAPLGDLPGALLAVMLAVENDRRIEWAYVHRVDEREFRFETEAMRPLLDNVPLSHPKVRGWILEALRDGEAELRDGVDGSE